MEVVLQRGDGAAVDERGFDALAVHQFEPPVAIFERRAHLTEAVEHLVALVVVEATHRIELHEVLARRRDTLVEVAAEHRREMGPLSRRRVDEAGAAGGERLVAKLRLEVARVYASGAS